MIPLSPPQWQTETWQEQLSGAFREVDSLLAALNLDARDAPYALERGAAFPLRVPRAFVEQMRRGDWYDPLLLQVLPLAREADFAPGYTDDPLQERNTNPVPGLIHKYHGRVLLVASPACAVHCRYCFRRHFPYEDNTPSRAHWEQALDYIRQRPEVHEVILSGGDPLALTDKRLGELVLAIENIPSVSTLRVHSRLPVVMPARLTESCIASLAPSRLNAVLVLHCNHPAEISPELRAGLAVLRHRGITLLNQSVLLRGVNDEAEVLCKLSKKLFNAGVLPYYLHVLDRVRGAAHFGHTDNVARNLHKQMMELLPGYLVPKLVREDPSIAHKQPL